MAELFLYGDIADTFAIMTEPFVRASAAHGPTIALLLQGGDGWEEYVERYRSPFEKAADVEVVPVVPDGAGAVSRDGLRVIETAGGIFMGGGDTVAYHAAFVASSAGELIRERCAKGIPFGGVSAGAMLAGEMCMLEGNSVDGRPLMVMTATETPEDLVVGRGLGLLLNAIVQAHLTELGCFPRLLAGVETSDASVGLGIDEPAGAHVVGDTVDALGRGMVWVIRRSGTKLELESLQPGDAPVSLRRS